MLVKIMDHSYGKTLNFARLVVELGVISAVAYSLALFVAAAIQAYRTIIHAFSEDIINTKSLMIAAIEQTDTLLVGIALLIIPLAMHTLFVGRLKNVPAWLHVHSFDDLKLKLLNVVITALGVNFFSVALEWKTGSDILYYGLALATVIGALTAYNVILSRQSLKHEDESNP